MKILLAWFFLICTITTFSQERLKKIEFYGLAKTNILHQGLDVENDTTNVKNTNYGHSLIDLGFLIRPGANTEIASELRIRNELGGFWGGAVTYGIRKLTLKGVVNDAIRYKIGDINLKMTPYTLYNNGYQDVVNEATVFQQTRELIDYEYYFEGNDWRQQGIQTAFGFDLNTKNFQSLDVNLFSVRNKVSDPNSATPDRLFSGGQVSLWTALGDLNYHSANLHDLKNTVTDINLYYNSVNSVSVNMKVDDLPKFSLKYEGGISTTNYQNVQEDQTNTFNDYYWNIGLNYSFNTTLKFGLSALNTGPQFRSPSAQNVRMSYSSSSNIFPTIGNDLAVRNMGLGDYLYNDVLYYNTFDEKLDDYNPTFSNALPYGLATPNRKGLSLHIKEISLKEILNLSSQLYFLSEIVGTGTTNLKSFTKLVTKGDFVYKKWKVKGGIAYETTSREGLSFETIDLSSMLVDFGVDFNLSENIAILYGGKFHSANGNELTTVYDNTNNPLYFQPSNYNDTKQYLHSAGLLLSFSERSTLTASLSTFTQYDENDYSVNQFHVLYRLNF
ncbi:MAG: hypothetical protein ACON4E_00085 [Flavobacteriales bacterium]